MHTSTAGEKSLKPALVASGACLRGGRYPPFPNQTGGRVRIYVSMKRSAIQGEGTGPSSKFIQYWISHQPTYAVTHVPLHILLQ